MQKLLLTLILTLSLPLFVSLPAGQAGAQTLSDLESKIAALLAQIQTLQAELQTLKSTEEPQTPQASVASSFTTTLGKGSEGGDVTALQRYLAKDPALYPEGLVSGYFGSLTEAAVKRFQQKHNIVSSGTPATTGYGVVGPKTRATLNALLIIVSPIGPSYVPSTSTSTPTVPYTPNTPNRSPNLSITGSRFVTLPNKVTLTAVATDDGKPVNTLTYLWSKVSGPGTVSFSSLTTKDTTATFSSTGNYQISATVSDGDLFASYTVALIVSPSSTTATTTAPATTTPTLPAPALTFSASQTTLTKGTATTLTWSSANAISCIATGGWSGSKTASGSATFTPQTTTTYTLLCKGGGGDQVSKSVTVTVTGISPASQPIAGADLNGYVAEYECRKGNPNCDVDVEALAKQACEVTITTADSDWSKIENNPSKTVFCIQVGDHTSKGTLELNFSGTAQNRKVLRYYSPSDDGLRPVDQTENKRAIIHRIRMVSEDYWIFYRLTLDGKGGCGHALEPPWSSVNDHADYNIFDSLLVEDYKGEMFANPGNWNTIQRSVVRNSIAAPEGGSCVSESMCIAVGEGSHFRVVNNEIYDCQKNIAIGDGVQDHVGLIVENNDLYATPAIYSDCKQNYNGIGPCALTESLLNLKAGGSETYPMKIFHNRLWGARRGDYSLGLTSGGDGELMGIGGTGDPSEVRPGHPGGDWVLLLNNIAFDAAIGFGTTYPTPDNISLIGNIFYDMKTHGSQYDPDAPSTFNFYGHLGNGEIYLNTIVKGEEWIEGTLDGGDVRCNAIIGAGAASATNFGGSGFQIAGNAFYETPVYSNVPSVADIVRATIAESNNTSYCFYRKLLTNPEQVCIPLGKTTTASPHYSQCSAGVGQRTGIGINDKIWTWADTLFDL